jgi:hypothetical protein
MFGFTRYLGPVSMTALLMQLADSVRTPTIAGYSHPVSVGGLGGSDRKARPNRNHISRRVRRKHRRAR